MCNAETQTSSRSRFPDFYVMTMSISLLIIDGPPRSLPQKRFPLQLIEISSSEMVLGKLNIERFLLSVSA